MNKQPSKAMIERMEFVNCLNRELNRKEEERNGMDCSVLDF